MLTWYIPTFHGDIKLEARGEEETLVHAWALTDRETAAMESLRSRATKKGLLQRRWAEPEAFPPVQESIVRTDAGMRVVLSAPINKVQAFLSKALKPDKQLLSVVRFSGGKMEEVRSPDERGPDPKAAAVAATVARPERGCPVPEFVKAEIRATRVLEAFLNEDQLRDFRNHNRFVSVGQDTGHKYMIISRLAQDNRYGNRSLFDLDRNLPVCVHDYDVPAAEEMLALHAFLSLPGWETWMLEHPHD